MKKEELRKVEFNTLEKKSDSEVKFKKHVGYFHQWGTIENGIVTKAIVEEITTGKVVLVEPDNITFINP